MTPREDSINYIDLFYIPEVSSYMVLKAFFAQLYKKKCLSICRDLSDFFYQMKQNPKFKNLLFEIKFKDNGVFKYSEEIEDNILTLQNVGLLGKQNPSFGKITINYSDDIAVEFLNSLSEDNKNRMEELVDQYIREA